MKFKNIKWNKDNNRPIVLLDMDDVTTDFLGCLLRIYNERMGTHAKVRDCESWNLEETFSPEILDIFKEKGFFANLTPKKGSLKAIKKLISSTRYDVYIVTACKSVQEYQEKVEWFAKNLPEFNPNRIIMCSEKYLIRGHVLVDDKIQNLNECQPFMYTFAYDMPHNKDCKHKKIKTLMELLPILDEIFYPEETKKE